MAKRSKECSDNEIVILVNSDSSDSNSSNSEKMDCSLSCRQETPNRESLNERNRASLRIKLRRSTDQSLFKIATHSQGCDSVKEHSVTPIKKSKRLQSKLLNQQKNVRSSEDEKAMKNNTVDYNALTEILGNVQLVKIMEKNPCPSSTMSTRSKDQPNICNLQEITEPPIVTVAGDNSKNKENKPNAELEDTLEVVDVIPDVITTETLKTKSHTYSKNKMYNDRKGMEVHHQSIKHDNIKKRNINIASPVTPLQNARTRLHVSFVPKSLPCREQEFNDIFSFLERKLIDQSGGCIYISGVPGTGKTATVNEVIKCLKKSVTKGDLDDFNYIEINSMKLSEPRQVYVEILKQLSGLVLSWERAHQALEKLFVCKSKCNSKLSPMTLLMIDELDLLCTKRQDVVYNILDWPTKLSGRLVVITIANTMDLPERLLMSRVTSRLGLTRLTFQPYDYRQLQEIVSTRLKSNLANSFKSEAIQLVARKVAAVSGDARRALDICRRATEIAESHGTQVVTMQDVNEALLEMIASAKVQAIKYCSSIEQIFLQAVCAEISRTGVEETCLRDVYNQFTSLCSFDGVKIPSVSETLGICARLGSSRLLICEHSRCDLYQKILLNVSSDDIHYALKKIDSD